MHPKRKANLRIKSAKKKKNKKYERIIKKIKEMIKKENAYIEKCKEYKKDIDFIDGVEIYLNPLDVSAKTINGVVILNKNLLFGEPDELMRYVIHEVVHVMQQETGKVNDKTNSKDYLDDENEQEAFRAQISYMSEYDDPEEIQSYLERLLDHHDIKGKERKEKIKELTKDL